MTLSAFAAGQPLLATLASNPQFLVGRGYTPMDLVGLACAAAFLPGLAAALLFVSMRGVHPVAGLWVHRTLMFGGAGLIALQLLARWPRPPLAVALALAVIAGAFGTWALTRFEPLRSALSFLAPAPLVFVAGFLFTGPVTKLVLPSGEVREATQQATPTPVVFVLFDELPLASLLDADGQINPVRFPSFAALSKRSTWYRDASAASTETLLSVPSALTGEAPDASRLPIAREWPKNLCRLLAPSHRIHALEPITDLCETRGENRASATRAIAAQMAIDFGRLYPRIVLPQLFEGEDAASTDPFDEFGGAAARGVFEDRVRQTAVVDQASAFLNYVEEIGPEPNAFHFVHVVLPHAPFRFYPSGIAYPGADLLEGQSPSTEWVDPFLAQQAWQRHLLQVQYVDRLLGKLVDRLEELDLLDRAWLVVAADHGIAFSPGERRREIIPANPDGAAAIARIPLFIKAPGQREGKVEAGRAKLTDVAPTLLTSLGIDIAWEIDGGVLPAAASRERLRQVQIARTGERVQLTDTELPLMKLLQKQSALFGTGGERFDVFRTGPLGALVGEPVSGERAAPARWTARLQETELHATVDIDSGVLPGFLKGAISGPSLPERALVGVSVNGNWAGFPEVARDRDRLQLFAMIPAELLRDGFNTFELFEVNGTSDALELRPIPVTNAKRHWALEIQDGRPVLVASDGKRVTVVDSGIEGWVDHAGPKLSGAVLSGWALDRNNLRAVDRVVVFSGRRFVGAIAPKIDRPGLVEDGKNFARMLTSGFVLRLPQEAIANGPDALKLFGISGDVAGQLKVMPHTVEALKRALRESGADGADARY